MRSLTAVVIGCGQIGSLYDLHRPQASPQTHAGAYAADPRIVLRGGADPDAGRRKLFADRWGVRAWADARELLEAEHPDLVSICTPPEHRYPLVAAAVEAGARAVWCEKPMATSVAEGQRIVEWCAAHDVMLAVNFIRRWDPLHQAVRQWLAGGGLGRALHAVCQYSRGVDNYASHAVDLTRFLFGEIARVRALPPATDGARTDPSLTGELITAAAPVTLVGCADVSYALFEFGIFGSAARLLLVEGGQQAKISLPEADLASGTLAEAEIAKQFPPGLQGTMSLVLDNIVKSVRGEEPLRCSGIDGLRALEVTEALKQSAGMNGMWIETGRERYGH